MEVGLQAKTCCCLYSWMLFAIQFQPKKERLETNTEEGRGQEW